METISPVGNCRVTIMKISAQNFAASSCKQFCGMLCSRYSDYKGCIIIKLMLHYTCCVLFELNLALTFWIPLNLTEHLTIRRGKTASILPIFERRRNRHLNRGSWWPLRHFAAAMMRRTKDDRQGGRAEKEGDPNRSFPNAANGGPRLLCYGGISYLMSYRKYTYIPDIKYV